MKMFSLSGEDTHKMPPSMTGTHRVGQGSDKDEIPGPDASRKPTAHKWNRCIPYR
jgi:hypothetical protein